MVMVDNFHARRLLFVGDHAVHRDHLGPMDLGTIVMLGVIAVEHPGPVVEPVIGRNTPGNRPVGIGAERLTA